MTVPTSVNDAPMNGDCNHDDNERDWTSNLTWWQSLIFLPLPRRQLIFCGCTAQQLKAKHVRVSTPEIFFQFPPQVLFLGINFLPVSKFSTPTVSSFTSSSFSHPTPYDCFLMNCPSVRGSLFVLFVLFPYPGVSSWEAKQVRSSIIELPDSIWDFSVPPESTLDRNVLGVVKSFASQVRLNSSWKIPRILIPSQSWWW